MRFAADTYSRYPKESRKPHSAAHSAVKSGRKYSFASPASPVLNNDSERSQLPLRGSVAMKQLARGSYDEILALTLLTPPFEPAYADRGGNGTTSMIRGVSPSGDRSFTPVHPQH